MGSVPLTFKTNRYGFPGSTQVLPEDLLDKLRGTTALQARTAPYMTVNGTPDQVPYASSPYDDQLVDTSNQSVQGPVTASSSSDSLPQMSDRGGVPYRIKTNKYGFSDLGLGLETAPSMEVGASSDSAPFDSSGYDDQLVGVESPSKGMSRASVPATPKRRVAPLLRSDPPQHLTDLGLDMPALQSRSEMAKEKLLSSLYRRDKEDDGGGLMVGGDDQFGGDSLPAYGMNYAKPLEDTETGMGNGNFYPVAAAKQQSLDPEKDLAMQGAKQIAPVTNAPPPAPAGIPSIIPPAPHVPTPSETLATEIANHPRPAMNKPSVWRDLAAAIAGGAVGAVTHGNPQAAAGVGNLVKYGPKAIHEQQEYAANRADQEARLKALDDAQKVDTAREAMLSQAETRKADSETRQANSEIRGKEQVAKDIDNRLKLSGAAATIGGKRVAADAPPTPGTVAMLDPMDIDIATGKPQGKTRIDVPENRGKTAITDPDLARDVFHVSVGTLMDTKDYVELLGKHIQFSNKPDTEAQIKDKQLAAEMASALGLTDPKQITPDQMNAARRMFTGDQLAATHLRGFIAANKRLPTAAEESAIVEKDFNTSHPPPAGPQTLAMIPDGKGGYTAQLVKPGGSVGAGAVTPAGMSSQNVPTAQTRTMAETAPKVIGLVNKVSSAIDQQRQSLGPAAGRWSEFMTGKIGAKNKEFTKLRTDVMLLQTLLMRMHVGARGGSEMMQHFKDLIDTSKQDPDNLKSALGEILDYAKAVAGDHNGPPEPAANAPAPTRPPGVPATAVFDATTRRWRVP